MKYVEQHERAWGMDFYPGRPKLEDIMKAAVVALWYPPHRKEPGYRISVHPNMKEVNQHLAYLVIHAKTRQPEKRLFRLFVHRQLFKVKSIKVVLEPVTEGA